MSSSMGGSSGNFGGGDGGDPPGVSQYHRPRMADYAELSSSTTTTTAEPPLPMPEPRKSGYYSSKLLDPNPNNNNNDDDSDTEPKTNSALEYLNKVRGLNKMTLRKFGVGLAEYDFPTDTGYVKTECITFPWIMKASDVRTQESLRGAEYQMPIRPSPPMPSPTSSNNSDNSDSTQSATTDTTTISAPTADDAAAPTADGAVAAVAAADGAVATTNKQNTSGTEVYDPFVTRRIKIRAVKEKAWQRLDPAGGGWGLFGLHTVPDDAKEIVLTEGEFDAMAVAQATGRPAVSLPNGCRSLPVPVLPLLERFDKIYLWMDSDTPGQEGAQTFAKKLGLNRCYVVHCKEAKDANEALLLGLNLQTYLDQARLIPHDRLLTFHDLRAEVLRELLEPNLYKGSEIPSLPLFTKIIKGFRRGEMTVLTGPTGSGKVRSEVFYGDIW